MTKKNSNQTSKKPVTPAKQKTLAIVVLVIAAAVLGAAVFITPADGRVSPEMSQEEFTRRLTEKLPQLMDSLQIPGLAVALIEEGTPVWQEAFGYSNLETGEKFSVTAPCRVESISKSVTAWGVLKLVKQGLVELDMPVTEYISSWEFPESTYNPAKMTIRMLLSNSAGMPLGTVGVHYNPAGTVPQFRAYLSAEAVPSRPAGAGFEYSNTGYNLLELVIEDVTGRDFAEYMRNEVLRPLGMEQADYDWNPSWNPAVPQGYGPEGGAIPAYVYPNKGAGGLFANLQDTAVFAAAEADPEQNGALGILSRKLIAEMFSPQIPTAGYYGVIFDSYGFGHFLESLPNGMKAVSHGGQGSGWMTHFYVLPDTKDGIVLLANSQRSWPLFASVFSEWSQWKGIPPVGMSYLVPIKKWLVFGSGIVILLSLLHLYRMALDLRLGRRGWILSPSKKRVSAGMWSLGAVVWGILTIGIVVWARSQDYFFLYSVLPQGSVYLEAALIVTGISGFLSAPIQRRAEDGK